MTKKTELCKYLTYLSIGGFFIYYFGAIGIQPLGRQGLAKRGGGSFDLIGLGKKRYKSNAFLTLVFAVG